VRRSQPLKPVAGTRMPHRVSQGSQRQRVSALPPDEVLEASAESVARFIALARLNGPLSPPS
jgi:hypothetical protein